MYSDEFEFNHEPEIVGYQVRLGINMQQFLQLYVEPVPGKPETYEDENRIYEFTYDRLMDLRKIAIGKAEHFMGLAQQCIAFHQAGATFWEVSTIFARRKGFKLYSLPDKRDIPYQADEDLMTLLFWAGMMHAFVFELDMTLNMEYTDPPAED